MWSVRLFDQSIFFFIQICSVFIAEEGEAIDLGKWRKTESFTRDVLKYKNNGTDYFACPISIQ